LPFGGAFLPYGGLGYSPYYQDYGDDYTPGYSEPGYSAPTTQFRQSFYPTPATALPVNVTVLVPVADAQVWIDGVATTRLGMDRLFESPPLEPNQNFSYTVKARWMQSGKAVTQERHVQFHAGQYITVNFRDSSRENVPRAPTPITIPQN
jgi:uncharacterized protein (TIGR03000 family)